MVMTGGGGGNGGGYPKRLWWLLSYKEGTEARLPRTKKAMQAWKEVFILKLCSI